MPSWWQSLVNCLAKSTRIPLLITGFVSDHEERPAPARSSPVAAPAEFLDIDVDKLARVFALIAADRFNRRPSDQLQPHSKSPNGDPGEPIFLSSLARSLMLKSANPMMLGAPLMKR